MEPTSALIVVLVGAAAILSAFSYRRIKGRRYKVTKPALRNLALRESEALIAFVYERQAGRPENDTVLKDHELPSRRVTLHDEETQRMDLLEEPLAASEGSEKPVCTARDTRRGARPLLRVRRD